MRTLCWATMCRERKPNLNRCIHSRIYKGIERLSKTQKSRMILRDIETRQFKFFGHVIRKCDLEETILSGYINGNRSRGRSRKTYLDDISEKLKRSRAECIRIAKKREEWRHLWKAYVCHQTRH